MRPSLEKLNSKELVSAASRSEASRDRSRWILPAAVVAVLVFLFGRRRGSSRSTNATDSGGRASSAGASEISMVLDARGLWLGGEIVDRARLGPALRSRDALPGVTTIRLNLTHGPHGAAVQLLDALRALGYSVAITR